MKSRRCGRVGAPVLKRGVGAEADGLDQTAGFMAAVRDGVFRSGHFRGVGPDNGMAAVAPFNVGSGHRSVRERHGSKESQPVTA